MKGGNICLVKKREKNTLCACGVGGGGQGSPHVQCCGPKEILSFILDLALLLKG